jgi:hypothetical protein
MLKQRWKAILLLTGIGVIAVLCWLLITHNSTTMESAPIWYGVTMREPGISSILSYRVPPESVTSEAEAAIVLTR